MASEHGRNANAASHEPGIGARRAALSRAQRRFAPRLAAVAGCVVLLLQTADVGAAESPSLTFDRANQLYEKGQYPDAIAAYNRLIESGKSSAALCFNLGNASYKAGQLGRALLHFRMAEQLAPRDPDIQANLRFARTQIQGGPPPAPPLWRRLLPRLALDHWTLLTMTLTWGWLGFWTVMHLIPASKPRLRLPLTLLGVAVAISGAGLLVTWRDQCRTQHAVVIQRETILRHGPLDESPSLQTLPDGQELLVVDQKNDWYQVTGASRGIGWLKTNQVARLRP